MLFLLKSVQLPETGAKVTTPSTYGQNGETKAPPFPLTTWGFPNRVSSIKRKSALPSCTVPNRNRLGKSKWANPKNASIPTSIRKESKMSKTRQTNVIPSAAPLIGQAAHVIQEFGTVIPMPIALGESTRRASAINLNQVLADTITLRDLYKKHHWQVSGPTFYQLHLLFDKHFNEQSELVDAIAERIMSLGGVSVAMSADVAEMTLIPRPFTGREEVPVQISRLLHAHEIILKEARTMARQASEEGDDGTNDLLVSQVIRTNELQVWFVAEHVVDVPLVHADGQASGKSASR
jgi:starvation-inducible DNA-binding protein